ncbi:hypothetical protein CU254_41980 (plasmid) [Amycolatopsis sp. AA4]|uniref:hypothetical protein n=1 Tax=Actinomycetes TaxID=1760 RepID=UPI0001B56C1B|nr:MULTISPECIES: hypothetical protein [Actinomycetes]ATY17149.1 hypothetical protein CU254_41980 [Amycolatopsis sp. AA4]
MSTLRRIHVHTRPGPVVLGVVSLVPGMIRVVTIAETETASVVLEPLTPGIDEGLADVIGQAETTSVPGRVNVIASVADAQGARVQTILDALLSPGALDQDRIAPLRIAAFVPEGSSIAVDTVHASVLCTGAGFDKAQVCTIGGEVGIEEAQRPVVTTVAGRVMVGVAEQARLTSFASDIVVRQPRPRNR